MDYQLFSISDEQMEMFSSMEVIDDETVKKLFKRFSTGKIKNVRVGKLHIKNIFFPNLKESGLPEHEEHYVFCALEKKKISFFSAPTYRLFILPIGSKTVFAVRQDSVYFVKPTEDSMVNVLLSEDLMNKELFTTNAFGSDHKCVLEKLCLYRTFDVYGWKIVAIKDKVVYHYSWTNPDRWAAGEKIREDKYGPMYLLRRSKEALLKNFTPCYPAISNHFEHDIDEN